MYVCVYVCRGVGRIFKGGFPLSSSEVKGAWLCYLRMRVLVRQERRKRGRDREVINFYNLETAVSANRHGAPAGVRECH